MRSPNALRVQSPRGIFLGVLDFPVPSEERPMKVKSGVKAGDDTGDVAGKNTIGNIR
jgi:hypothetical protein